MSSPPRKRRRTSSPRRCRPDDATEDAPPRRSRSPTTPVQPEPARRNPLEGFDDEEEPADEPAAAREPSPRSQAAAKPARRPPDQNEQGDSNRPEADEEEEEHCAICLSPIENKVTRPLLDPSPGSQGDSTNLGSASSQAVVSPCHHGQFCWGCIRAWTDQSRKVSILPLCVLDDDDDSDPRCAHPSEHPSRFTPAAQCPLCLGPIKHLYHNIRSAKDYQTHYLLPLHTVLAAPDLAAVAAFPPPPSARSNRMSLPRHALYGRQRSRFSSSNRVGPDEDRDEATWREREQERALERRRYIYREGLYAKHVASNRYTGFKPFSPDTFSKNAPLRAKVIKFIRREASPRTSR